MTDQQKLSKAIQDEIGKRSMRELALNSLRMQYMQHHFACNLSWFDELIIQAVEEPKTEEINPFAH